MPPNINSLDTKKSGKGSQKYMNNEVTLDPRITFKIQKFSEPWIPQYVHDFQVFGNHFLLHFSASTQPGQLLVYESC